MTLERSERPARRRLRRVKKVIPPVVPTKNPVTGTFSVPASEIEANREVYSHSHSWEGDDYPASPDAPVFRLPEELITPAERFRRRFEYDMVM